MRLPLIQQSIRCLTTTALSPSSIRPIVVSGPSGCGKSTIIHRLIDRYPNTFGFSVSHTTRDRRIGEINGEDYWFVDREQMNRMLSDDQFLEHNEFIGNIYATSKKSVDGVLKSGLIPILDVELHGVRSIKNTDLHAKFIWISPPSIEALEKRLVDRKTETADTLSKKLEQARIDMAEVEADKNLFDAIIINDNRERATERLVKAIADELKAFKATHP